ncbi:hypothetical protein D9M69_560030 [compost metagenome]
MEVDAQADVRADGVAHRLDVFQHALDLGVAVDEMQLLGAIHLHRGEAAFHRRPGRLRGVRRTVAADPGIGADTLAHRAAEQLMHRHAEVLALDVPEGLVDAGDGAHQHRAATVEAAAVHDVPQVLDVARVLADQIVGKLVDGGRHRVRPALYHRLAPAADADIGIDAQEQPARRDQEGGEAGDLHARDSCCAAVTVDQPRANARARLATSAAVSPGV